jgi:DMSO reductase anchor subunit
MEAIAALPLVLAVVFAELAVGGAALLLFLDRTQNTPAGFRKLTSSVDLVVIACAAALIPTLPRGALAERAGLHVGPLAAFGQALPFVLGLLLVHTVACFTPWRWLRDAAGVLAVVAGAGVLGVAASARPGEAPYDPFALVAIPLGALALGGSNAAMLLGHWYLVTPKLSPAPLQRAAVAVLVALALQAALVAVSIARGELAGITQTALWIAVALRVGVGLLMAGGVALGAWWTARLNTQSSTGLLYVGLGCVLAGEVAARVIFFLTGAAL